MGLSERMSVKPGFNCRQEFYMKEGTYAMVGGSETAETRQFSMGTFVSLI